MSPASRKKEKLFDTPVHVMFASDERNSARNIERGT
jgi:hypothetical protein